MSNYTNPTPAQRAALAANADFITLIQTAITAYAYAQYVEPASNPDSNQNVTLAQIVTNNFQQGNRLWSTAAAVAVAQHQDAPVGWFALTDDFSSVDPDALDNLIGQCFKTMTGYVNYSE